MRSVVVMLTVLLLLAAGALAAEEAKEQPKAEAAATSAAQQRQQVRIAANRRAMRQRIQDLRKAVTFSQYELIRDFRAKDPPLLLALLNREFRAASKLLLSFSDADIERLLEGGSIERKAQDLCPRQLFLARIAADVDDPAVEDVGSIVFTGVDTGVIEFQWLPDAETLARAGPPSGQLLRFVLIPAGRELLPGYREILRDELRRTPYQGLLPKQ